MFAIISQKLYNPKVMKLSKKDVEHAAKLARLGLSEEEKELFTKQLAQILDYADTINKLDTKGVPPTSHAIPMKNVFRDDKVVTCRETDEIIRNAPEEEGRMFKVPKILE
jgi:aspartyl-tRNA(Asn)/glutamyl-tRNA(Gln) amidotransferase subunit C